MTDGELRAAAERLRAWGRGERQRGYDFCRQLGDYGLLATAWLAERPADDATPLTLDWINSVAGEGPVVNRGYAVVVGPLVYEPVAEELGGTVELHPEHDGKILRTRGDVRRVASATGEPITEPTP